MEEKKVPALRFRGFDNAWEQHKLGEVATYRRGSFPQPYGKSEWYDGNGAMPFVQVADVSDEMNLVEDTKQKISILAQPMSVFVEQNSVLVTLQGSIGRVAIMQYDAFVDRTVLIFEKYKAEIDKTFWAYIIKQKFIDEARKAPGGTIKTITKEALSDFDLSIPKYQEQKQIGEYFRNLDHLISLHQRKLEMLKKVKKSMLEKMFPKNDAKVPEVRFSDFTDAWEQRCLGECFEERNENMPKGELISVTINDGVKRFSELGRHDNSNENKSKYKKVCVGDIPYNSMRMWQGASGYSMYEGIVSPAYTVLKPKEGVNSRCVSYLFKREDMIHTFQLNSQGITSDNWNLKYPKLSQIGIFLPLNLREQEKIVECFVKLDHLISLHQRKLEKLKNIKKSMLEKMFII